MNCQGVHIVPGSVEAKKLWVQIDAQAHSPEAVKAAKTLNPKAEGMYLVKPLVPGEAGAGQGDFKFMVDKLVYHDGHSVSVAKRIAGKQAIGL